MDVPIVFGPLNIADDSVGVEINGEYFTLAEAIAHNIAAARRLAALYRTRAVIANETAAYYEGVAAAAERQLAQLADRPT